MVELDDPPALLNPYDNVIGLLLSGDVVEMEVPAVPFLPGFPHHAYISMWLPNGEDTNGVELWARCGTRVLDDGMGEFTTTRSSSFVSTPEGDSGPTGAFLFLRAGAGGCSTNWFIAVRNTTPNQIVFRLTARAAHAAWGSETSPLNVGIAWNATPSQIAQIIQTVRRAAYAFHGLSDGTLALEHFRIYNNATNCDNGWPQDHHACFGRDCRFCWSETMAEPQDMRTRTWTGGFIDVRDPDGPGPMVNTNWQNLAHEMAHSFIQLSDEYDVLDDSFTGLCAWYPTCGSSYMARVGDINLNSYCNAGNHRTSLRDHRTPGFLSVTNGPDAFACDGSTHFTTNGPSWDWINGRYLTAFPVQSSANYTYDFLRGRADRIARIIEVVQP